MKSKYLYATCLQGLNDEMNSYCGTQNSKLKIANVVFNKKNEQWWEALVVYK